MNRIRFSVSSKRPSIQRPNDMFYDPLFIVSGPKDHYKNAKIAVMTNAKLAVRPIFPTMFTDLPHVPSRRIVLKTSTAVPKFQKRHADEMKVLRRKLEVGGADRYKFFARPVEPYNQAIPTLTLPPESVRHLEMVHDLVEDDKKKEMVSEKVQTVYRESSAQTSPWEPDFTVVDGSDPEILKLNFLKWGSGLPAGMHEIKLIERARMKKHWERSLPPVGDAKGLKKRRDVISAMEREEWLFREQEIQDIQNLRMELLKKMLQELLENSESRSQKKMQMFCKMKLAEKAEKLAKLERESTREKRRLDFHHRGIIMKYHPVNVVDEHVDYKSELYAPMMRHGVHPKRQHQVISEHMKKYQATYKGVEKYNTLPTWLDEGPVLDERTIKLPGTRLCIRETKWTDPVLKQLHEELKRLREVTKKKCSLRIRVPPKEEQPATPEVEDVDDMEESNNQGLILVQSVLRGRSAQILVFEGRDNCRELIQELRSTHGVLNKQKIEVFKQKLEVKYDQREEVFCIANSSKIQEALSKLQGTLVGTLLDFLNKELRRLLDERKAHALGIMAERERQRREAAEAGRRQYELRRRLEHDELFRQIAKIHQETVDMYLEDIITEGMEFASKDEAKQYVVSLAEKMDKEMAENEELLKSNFLEQEDMIADLMHHFVLPEVEKAIVRRRIKKRQEVELKGIHGELFGTIDTLPRPIIRMRRKRKPEKSITIADSGKVVQDESSTHHISSSELEILLNEFEGEEVEEEEEEEEEEDEEKEEIDDEVYDEEQEEDVQRLDVESTSTSESIEKDFVEIYRG